MLAAPIAQLRGEIVEEKLAPVGFFGVPARSLVTRDPPLRMEQLLERIDALRA
jgi:hypothetical protein